VSTDLTPAELLESAAAFAELHRWAALAWQHVATERESRKAILADVEDMTDRLDGLRIFLGKSGAADEPEGGGLCD
jgi:hypothetical protein